MEDVKNVGVDSAMLEGEWLVAETSLPVYGSDNAVVRLSFQLALTVLAYVSELEGARHYVVARQLVRCGTSVGTNVREAQHAESRADFIHKCKIAAKEAEETGYWLQLCTHAPNYPTPPVSLTDTLLSVRRLLARIIISSKAKASNATAGS
ncbi:four helix bundle protein [Hymenobacter baengnokdamensis]|uniref:four helix bundle protein n=1 Tax=Hymenobacter baengnokdamensis TaxID=2615203 RepID=UPI001E28DB5F|nr:four helix bundle protein [Hymenobacter baengnokdamensis]